MNALVPIGLVGVGAFLLSMRTKDNHVLQEQLSGSKDLEHHDKVDHDGALPDASREHEAMGHVQVEEPQVLSEMEHSVLVTHGDRKMHASKMRDDTARTMNEAALRADGHFVPAHEAGRPTGQGLAEMNVPEFHQRRQPQSSQVSLSQGAMQHHQIGARSGKSWSAAATSNVMTMRGLKRSMLSV